jgi:hypothetical protein
MRRKDQGESTNPGGATRQDPDTFLSETITVKYERPRADLTISISQQEEAKRKGYSLDGKT